MSLQTVVSDTLARMLRLGGIRKDTVTFMSFGGQSYSCNPRAVSEALHRLDEKVRIQWLSSKPESTEFPDYVEVVDRRSNLAFLKALATTAVLVDNSRLPMIPKGKGQMFIQLWHGDKAFKKVLYDSDFVVHKAAVPESVKGYCDLAVAGSDYGVRQFRSAFQYEGRILTKGTPRNDCLVHPDPEQVARMKREIGARPDTRVLLYAPTLRREYTKNGQKQVIQEIDFARTLAKLTETTGEKWICAVRAHPSMKGLTGFDPSAGILDLSRYPDMTDLLLAVDMLITDYSSCAGDFAVTGRPVLLYQPDIEAYLEKDRTFYFEMSDSPYMIAQNQEELEALIAGLTPEKARENDRAILAFYGDCETGHAAEAVAEEILSHLRSV